MTVTDYNGPERRQDYVALDQALDQVDRLHGAVSTLATAVTNTVPRRELEDLRDEVRKDYLTKIYFMAGFSVAIIIVLLSFINMKINTSSKQASHGHAVIECLLGLPADTRTGTLAATSLVTCEQTVK
jgi:hypothetical protein